MTSNSSIAGSGRAYSSDMEESTFLKRSRIIHIARLVLSFLSFGVAIAVVACEAQSLRHYKDTSQWATAGLALWPLNLDIRPTIAETACGCVIAVLNLVYIAAALTPSPYSRIKLLNMYALASALAGFITVLVGILFAIYLPSSSYPAGFSTNETLHSWTCKWKTGTSDSRSPSLFYRDCKNTGVGFILLCVVGGMEILMGIIAAVGMWFQRDVSRRREQQFQLEKLEVATKHVYQG